MWKIVRAVIGCIWYLVIWFLLLTLFCIWESM
jgi:hypothetical protein